jgi:hypothetical protein
MKLLTKEIIDKLPKLYATEKKKPEEVSIIVKFFCPWNSWSWLVTEGEKQGDDFLFFGYVKGNFPELEYFSLKELESVRGHLGLKIERDMHYEGHKLSEVME